jgi:protein MpaA
MNFIELKSGTSVEGSEIKAFRTESKSQTWVYLIAGVHGDEVEGVYVLQQLFDWLKKDEETNLAVIVVPIVNIDGYRQGTRVNAHGVDLNRNLPAKSWEATIRAPKYHPGSKPLSEPENAYLDKLFQKYPPRFILSFHSWKPILNTNGNCRAIAELLERYNSYPIYDDSIGYPTPGSLGDYAPEKYNSPVLTFECPLLSSGKTLKEIWEENRPGLEVLMKSDLLK